MADLIALSANLDALRRAGRDRILKSDKEAARDLLDDEGFAMAGDGERQRAVELWARKIRVEAELSTASALERCRKALEPFAEIPLWRDTYPDARSDCLFGEISVLVSVEQVREARATLNDLQEGNDGR